MKHGMVPSNAHAVSLEEASETAHAPLDEESSGCSYRLPHASPAEGPEAQPAFPVNEPAETAAITRELLFPRGGARSPIKEVRMTEEVSGQGISKTLCVCREKGALSRNTPERLCSRLSGPCIMSRLGRILRPQ